MLALSLRAASGDPGPGVNRPLTKLSGRALLTALEGSSGYNYFSTVSLPSPNVKNAWIKSIGIVKIPIKLMVMLKNMINIWIS
jgi:hypothetical protein